MDQLCWVWDSVVRGDGIPNSGSLQTQAQIEAFRRENFSQQIKTFAIGLGSDYNADIVSSLGDEFFNITAIAQIHSIFSGICKEIYSLDTTQELNSQAFQTIYYNDTSKIRILNIFLLL